MKAPGVATLRGAFMATLLGAPGCASDANTDTQVVIDAQTVVSLDRTACMGACPDYALTVGGDGTVTFVGRRYVKVVGTATGQIPVADVQTLVETMEQLNYFGLSVPTTCESVKTDSPTATTSLTITGTTHTVQHYHGNLCAPEALHTIEDLIDIVGQSGQWVKCDTATGICPL